LLAFDNVIVTPHLGASTTEAQEGVAVTVAEQMRDYFFNWRFARRSQCTRDERAAVANASTVHRAGGKSRTISGAALDDKAVVREVQLEYAGELAEMDAAPVTRAFVAGLCAT
jgi:D-3-phosphoglycerate dehydrogenase